MPETSRLKSAAVIIPPYTDFYATPHRFSTLGARIVAQLLRNQELQVHFFNFPLDYDSLTTSSPIPQILHYLKQHINPGETGRSTYFTKYKRYGPSELFCAQELAAVKPDIICISCFAFCYADTTITLCQEIRRMLPDSIIVCGGAGVSALPDYFLHHETIDYVITGEAEVSIPLLIRFLQGELHHTNDIPNLYTKNSHYLKNGNRIYTHANQIEPAYALIENVHSIRINLTLSRGCPLGCSFCSNYLCHGTEHRHISDEHIKSMMSDIRREIGIRSKPIAVNFEDDNILLDFEFWEYIIGQFKHDFPDMAIYAENGIDYRLLTLSQAQRLVSLGMAQFNFSLGSIHEEILSLMTRKSDLDHYDRLLSLAKQHEIPVVTYFICGMADDTKESIARNLIFLSKRDTLIGISLFYPVPGITGFTNTSIFKQGQSILCCGSSAYPWNNSVDTTTMITAFRLARILNCHKSLVCDEMEREVIKATLSKRRIHTIVKKNRTRQVTEVQVQDSELVEMVLNIKNWL